MRSKGTNRSSYGLKVLSGDRPFRYSQEYQDWFRAARAHNDAKAREEAEARWQARRNRISVPA